MTAPHLPLRTTLEHGAWLELHPGWLAPAEAEQLRLALLSQLAWEQRHIVLFGKRILQPRLIAWAGQLPYRYSGQTLEPRPWPAALCPQLEPLCARVAAQAGAAFNHVLVNRYRDGNDSMGYHADDEPELGEDPVVATLSLGATRRFQLRAQRAPRGERALVLPLSEASLLIMGGTCQRHYRHAIAREAIAREAIAREAGALGERISLTFRQLLRPPSG
jgi:alkylated DNA repair dioxygenase AlkB